MARSEQNDKAQILRLIQERLDSLTALVDPENDGLFDLSISDLSSALGHLEKADDLIVKSEV